MFRDSIKETASKEIRITKQVLRMVLEDLVTIERMAAVAPMMILAITQIILWIWLRLIDFPLKRSRRVSR